MLEWAASLLGTLLLLLFLSYKTWCINTLRTVVSSKPLEGLDDHKLIYKPSALANYLVKQCKTFSGFTKVHWLWRTFPNLQTLVGVLGPVDKGVHFVREHLQLSDDGLVALDWAVKPGHQQKRRRASSNSSVPILLVIPNSIGKITRNTSKMCHLALTQGYQAVIFNRRCQNGCPLNTIKLQPYGDPNDLREAVRYIRHCQPSSRLFAAGEGTGAGLLLSYLGECGSSSYITAAGCISPLFRMQDWFEAGCPWLWRNLILLYQKIQLSRYVTALGQIINTDKLFGSKTLQELEEVLFCQTKVSGNLSWDSYWEKNDPLRDIDEVAIPVLCICSQDDPIRGDPNNTVPIELFETNPHFFLLLTRHGGHCGFIKEDMASTIWSHSALLDFFKSAVDFFVMEEKLKGLSRRKRKVSISLNRMAPDRTCRNEQSCPHNIHEIYNWQRSYTR
ncbi:protein ABHD15-like [Spea bombifrons]|uniref:protein ABHD15-like n=1 Tax=Spea bombifrons TaxID=233779 RepID=UPI0023490248|nr:protein ABHD15-like [Spea bombifrons]